MNNLSNYILEKLKINKDTKVNDDLSDFIMSIVQYDTEDNAVLNAIKKWIKDNDVELVSIYINKSNENGKEYRNSLDKDIKNKIEFVKLSKYIEEFNNIFPKVSDYNKFTKFANYEFSMRAVDKGIEFEKKEYEILVKRRSTIYDI